jgi:DNA polymerase III gamma/tau subunit
MKMPTHQEVYMYLASICKKMGLTKETTIPKEFFGEGLQFIAENSEYSFRKAIQYLEQCYTGRIFTKDEIKTTFDIVSTEDAIKALIDIANGNKSKLAWDAINGNDYQDKFPLMMSIIGDAYAIKTFGTEYVENEELWKWKDKQVLSNAKYFDELCKGFMELASKAYISRGEWKIVCTRILDKSGHLVENTPPVVKKTGRSKVTV